MKRVVVTGMSGISPLGTGWPEVRAHLHSLKNATVHMKDWDAFEGLNSRLAAPAKPFTLPSERYTKKSTRSMGRVALLAVRATELALEDAGLLGADVISSGDTGVAYGSSWGSPDAVEGLVGLMRDKTTRGINATTYVRVMGHTSPVNIGVFFQCKGRIIPTSSACTSGSQGLGYAFEAIKFGQQKVMLAGGAEELHPSSLAVFDTLFAASTKNQSPDGTPRPFDKDRDGLVIGEGACTFVLEELSHAKARGARIHAELLGFGTNSDGTHITNPRSDTMRRAMELALESAGIPARAVGYVNAHGTGTSTGDVAESQATTQLFGERMPVSSLKSYMGHTLGACGALEAWMSVMMMNEGWVAPTLNLKDVDPDCGRLDYLQGDLRELKTDVVMSNNFAFGGINTSLVFRRWRE
jgi:3-oxoacyl-[acyl-carrier-protein] synthase II